MKNKHIYIDESGILNEIFIICFIVFLNKKNLDKTVLKINSFKDPEKELHFNKESFAIKKRFFNILPKDCFYVYYYKSSIKKSNLSDNQHLIKSLIDNKDIINNSIIFIDGYKTRSYKKNISSEIKKELKKYNINIKSIKYIDSKNSNLIQLADMCAGCIRRKFEINTVKDNELFNLIKPHIK